MYLLGLDGGGTKTAAALYNSSTGEIHTQFLGCGNVCVLGRDGCVKLFEQMLCGLLSEVDISKIDFSTFAFAGVGRTAQQKILESVATEFGFKRFTVVTDAQILHYSFFKNELGVLISSGTGSICLVNPFGDHIQIGGWGYILGDDGSGFHIGKLSISHILEEFQSGKSPSKLSLALLDYYAVDNASELITKTYSSDSPQTFVASCARIITRLGQNGDQLAIEIIDTASASLVKLASKAIKLCPTGTKVKIALAGGVLSGESFIAFRFKQLIKDKFGEIDYIDQEYQPAAAAVIYSAQQNGNPLMKRDLEILSKADFKEE